MKMIIQAITRSEKLLLSEEFYISFEFKSNDGYKSV